MKIKKLRSIFRLFAFGDVKIGKLFNSKSSFLLSATGGVSLLSVESPSVRSFFGSVLLNNTTQTRSQFQHGKLKKKKKTPIRSKYWNFLIHK